MHAHAQATARKGERARHAGDSGADDRDIDCSLRPGVDRIDGSSSQNGVSTKAMLREQRPTFSVYVAGAKKSISSWLTCSASS